MFKIRCNALLTKFNKFKLSSLMSVNNLYSLRNTVVNNGFIIQTVSSSHFHISAEISPIQLLVASRLEWVGVASSSPGQIREEKSNAEAKIKDLQCKICHKTFTTLSWLKRHSQHHTGNYSYFCDQCRKGFVEKSHYEIHMRAHEGRGYSCEYCSKRYSSRQNLQYHMSEHTGRYRFTCGICKKGFNEKAWLRPWDVKPWFILIRCSVYFITLLLLLQTYIK